MSKQQKLLHALQADYMTTAAVVFDGHAKQYTYKVKKSWGVEVGDSLVVASPSTGMTCVKVVRVDDLPDLDDDSAIKYTWAVQKVDRTDHVAMLAKEATFLAQLRQVDQAHQRETMLAKAREALKDSKEASGQFEEVVKGMLEA